MHKCGQNGKGRAKSVVGIYFKRSSPKPDSWYTLFPGTHCSLVYIVPWYVLFQKEILIRTHTSPVIDLLEQKKRKPLQKKISAPAHFPLVPPPHSPPLPSPPALPPYLEHLLCTNQKWEEKDKPKKKVNKNNKENNKGFLLKKKII